KTILQKSNKKEYPNMAFSKNRETKYIKKIESLQTANANKGKEIDKSPQLEYPLCFNDVIYSPAMDLDIVSELKNAKSPILANVIHFAKNLIDSFPIFVKTRRFL
ncbi:MAG: hypothetical protein J6T46_00700, partial [Victivallales bacterium]|nr:hypothetical protein [Victivallales bacterium]